MATTMTEASVYAQVHQRLEAMAQQIEAIRDAVPNSVRRRTLKRLLYVAQDAIEEAAREFALEMDQPCPVNHEERRAMGMQACYHCWASWS